MTIPLRIFRSCRANFYANDIRCAPEHYADAYFDALTAHGFNAVWLRGLLRDLATTDVFPELGEEVAAQQDALGLVVERAAAHGVRVLLYLQEPQALPAAHPFWTHHPEARGHTAPFADYAAEPLTAFCTSEAAVRAWLRAAMTGLFRAVPGLGGWFAITASEYPAHCYSRILGYRRGERTTCPRCRARQPMAIVREVLEDLHQGTRAASPDALTIAWNWSWAYYEADPQPSLLPYLPADMAVMLDWERGGHHALPNGKPYFVDEYSLAYPGPSARCMALYDAARRRGLPVMVKLQVGTTHELATVPNLPVVDTLYRKLLDAERLGVAGLLATWNFGNTFSLNTAAVARFADTVARPAPATFVARLAESYFGIADGGGVAAALETFSAALVWFPSDQDLLYFWPGNYAPAYPLTLAPLTGAPMGWSCLAQERGDDLSATETQFTAEEIVDCLDNLLVAWDEGVALLDAALAGASSATARLERGVAHAIGHIFRSR
ncbi:MAG TPA: hypothetical protein PK794_00420 [Armatimonadota bacterium]|nr:hypothetical protein [Armatimonadota bacterium]